MFECGSDESVANFNLDTLRPYKFAKFERKEDVEEDES